MCSICEWNNVKLDLAAHVQRIGQAIENQIQKVTDACGQLVNRYDIRKELTAIRCDVNLWYDEETGRFNLYCRGVNWNDPKEHLPMSLTDAREMVSKFSAVTIENIRQAVLTALSY